MSLLCLEHVTLHADEAWAHGTQTDSLLAPPKCLRHIGYLVSLICQELEGNLLVANELHVGVHIIAAHSQHCTQSIA